MLYELDGVLPRLGKGAWVAPDATVIGDVWLGAGSTVWFKSVLRGDTNRIRIGDRTNVQDASVLHVNPGAEWALTIGNDVTIGHACIVHAAPCRTAPSSAWARRCWTAPSSRKAPCWPPARC